MIEKHLDIHRKEKVIYNPGGFNSPNDFQVYDEKDKRYIPCICGHGGSGWLCNECSARFYYFWQNNILNLSNLSNKCI